MAIRIFLLLDVCIMDMQQTMVILKLCEFASRSAKRIRYECHFVASAVWKDDALAIRHDQILRVFGQKKKFFYFFFLIINKGIWLRTDLLPRCCLGAHFGL